MRHWTMKHGDGLGAWFASRWATLPKRWRQEGDPGQGTTEYAILVGVLVVVAIAAIILLRPMIEALWNGIVDGIGQLG